MFVAIFFIAVGMLIDPRVILEHWVAVFTFTLLLAVGKVVAVSTGVFLAGRGLRPAIQAGMSLAHIGEFSFIIAGIGAAAGVTRSFLYPVAVTVSAIMTLATPWLIRAAGPVAHFVDQNLPGPLQTFTALYGSWVERVREAPRTADVRIRRLIRLLLLDAGVLAVLIIGLSTVLRRVAGLVREWTDLSPRMSMVVTLLFAFALAAPLVVGAVRTARKLGLALAVRAMPAAEEGRVDFAAAPRRAMVITVQLAILLAMVTALAAITQPFLPGLPGAAFPLLVGGAFGVAFWRSAKNLEGHARAGAEVIASALAGHLAQKREADQLSETMQKVREMLPGLGDPMAFPVRTGSTMDGQTLAELDLRTATGATVLAIIRDGEHLLVPDGEAEIRAGDVLAVAGSHDALDAVRDLSGRATGSGGSPAKGTAAVT
jgi:CPA2 family monovalent cation:H+ antiporter-2